MHDSAPAAPRPGIAQADAAQTGGAVQADTAQSGAVRADTTQRTDTTQPIPYRSDANSMAASTGSAMLVAVLLLAALALALHFAKRRGLLDRWIVAAPGRASGRLDMQVVRALRVSPKTTVYRIRDADRHYLLVESLAQTTLTPLSDDDTAIHNDEEHDDAH